MHLAKQGVCARLPACGANFFSLHLRPCWEAKGEQGGQGWFWEQPCCGRRLCPAGPCCGQRCHAWHGGNISADRPLHVLGSFSLGTAFHLHNATCGGWRVKPWGWRVMLQCRGTSQPGTPPQPTQPHSRRAEQPRRGDTGGLWRGNGSRVPHPPEPGSAPACLSQC